MTGFSEYYARRPETLEEMEEMEEWRSVSRTTRDNTLLRSPMSAEHFGQESDTQCHHVEMGFGNVECNTGTSIGAHSMTKNWFLYDCVFKLKII